MTCRPSPRWHRSARLAATLSVVASACALSTDTAHAAVREVSKANGRVRYPATGYTPLYPGVNDLLLSGPGVDRATALSFPPGVASRVTIGARQGGPSQGTLSVRVEIKPSVRGKMSARVVYAQGTPPEIIKARVFARGTVERISMESQRAVVGEPHRVRFVGSAFGVTAMRDAPGVYTAARVGCDQHSADFDVTFSRCGTLWLDGAKLHDAQVPATEVQAGLAAYRGDAAQLIVVGPRPGETCPPTTGNDPGSKFCAPSHAWDPVHSRCVRAHGPK